MGTLTIGFKPRNRGLHGLRATTRMFFALVGTDAEKRHLLDRLFQAGLQAGLTEMTARDLTKEIAKSHYDSDPEALGLAMAAYAEYLVSRQIRPIKLYRDSVSFLVMLDEIAKQVFVQYEKKPRGVKTLNLAKWMVEMFRGEPCWGLSLLKECKESGMNKGIIEAFCATLPKTEIGNQIREALGAETIEPTDEIANLEKKLIGLLKPEVPVERDRIRFTMSKLKSLKDKAGEDGSTYVRNLVSGIRPDLDNLVTDTDLDKL